MKKLKSKIKKDEVNLDTIDVNLRQTREKHFLEPTCYNLSRKSTKRIYRIESAYLHK